MAKRVTPDAVIDLTLDSDDEQESRLSDIRKNLYKNDQKKKKAKINSNDVVELLDSPVAAVAAAVTATSSQYDGVEIVDAPAATIAEEETTNSTDGDVVMVGTINEMRLPHMRPHCTKFQFQPNSNNRSDIRMSNALHCDLCYCYVCDKPVKECSVSSFSTVKKRVLSQQ